MITYVVQIGNSDNKLSQAEWSLFVEGLAHLLANMSTHIHFFGFSSPAAAWQNCCAVFDDPRHRDEWEFQKDLEQRLADLAAMFRQDAIALQFGHMGFIKAAS